MTFVNKKTGAIIEGKEESWDWMEATNEAFYSDTLIFKSTTNISEEEAASKIAELWFMYEWGCQKYWIISSNYEVVALAQTFPCTEMVEDYLYKQGIGFYALLNTLDLQKLVKSVGEIK